MTGPLFALALVVVAGLAWHLGLSYVRAVVATREHAAKLIGEVRTELAKVDAARVKLSEECAELLSQVKRLHARMPEGGLVPRGPR